jgi:hypothetical protein
MANSDEFMPLIEKQVKLSADKLRAEMQVMKTEFQTDLQDISQRSLRMEEQLQELITLSRRALV